MTAFIQSDWPVRGLSWPDKSHTWSFNLAQIVSVGVATLAPSQLVHEQSTSSGEGNFTLVTCPPPQVGRQTFEQAFGHGVTPNIFNYYIMSQTLDEWEYGIGHLSDATTLVRDTPIRSSNGNGRVVFSAGTKDVTNSLAPNAFATVDIGNTGINYIEVQNAVAGGLPSFQAAGLDSIIGLTFNVKGNPSSKYNNKLGSIVFNLGAGNYPSVQINSTSPTGKGSQLTANVTHAPVTGDQIFSFVGQSPNSAGTPVNFGQIFMSLSSSTAGSETGEVDFQPVVNGTQNASIFSIGNGVVLGGTPVSPGLPANVNAMPGVGNLAIIGGQGIYDENANAQLLFSTVGAAVDYLQITNGASGSPGVVKLSALGTDSNIDLALVPKGTGNVSLPGGTLVKTTAALTNGAGASAATLTNSPATGNPTKWIPINDNGTTRYIPAW